MEYGGIVLGFLGSFPVSEKIDLGLNFKLFFNPTVSESSAKNSGSPSKPNINTFGLLSTYHYKPNLNLVARFDLEYYSSDFDGGGSRPESTTNISHKIITLLGGVEYLFWLGK